MTIMEKKQVKTLLYKYMKKTHIKIYWLCVISFLYLIV